MAFTYGFYDSINHDRKYTAEQISSLFDGLITDGVFDSIGNKLSTIPGEGLQVLVRSGKAWFNHTWSINDADYPLNLSQPDVTLSRIDAVVLEVNTAEAVRANSLKVITGTASTSPVKPSMPNTEKIFYHPLAYVTVPGSATAITASNISIVVGMTECPYVTGLVEHVDITDLFSKWEGEFETWFEGVQGQLQGDVAANLLYEIDQRVKIVDKATEEEAKAAVDDTKWLTPAMGKILTDANKVSVGEVVFSNTNPGSDYVALDGSEIPSNLRTNPVLKQFSEPEYLANHFLDSIVASKLTYGVTSGVLGGSGTTGGIPIYEPNLRDIKESTTDDKWMLKGSVDSNTQTPYFYIYNGVGLYSTQTPSTDGSTRTIGVYYVSPNNYIGWILGRTGYTNGTYLQRLYTYGLSNSTFTSSSTYYSLNEQSTPLKIVLGFAYCTSPVLYCWFIAPESSGYFNPLNYYEVVTSSTAAGTKTKHTMSFSDGTTSFYTLKYLGYSNNYAYFGVISTSGGAMTVYYMPLSTQTYQLTRCSGNYSIAYSYYGPSLNSSGVSRRCDGNLVICFASIPTTGTGVAYYYWMNEIYSRYLGQAQTLVGDTQYQTLPQIKIGEYFYSCLGSARPRCFKFTFSGAGSLSYSRIETYKDYATHVPINSMMLSNTIAGRVVVGATSGGYNTYDMGTQIECIIAIQYVNGSSGSYYNYRYLRPKYVLPNVNSPIKAYLKIT